jgi:hypothetical protein
MLQVKHMVRHTNPQHRAQPAQEPALPYTLATPYGATQTHIIEDSGDRVCVQHGYCQNAG